jgi:hypothetical protein
MSISDHRSDDGLKVDLPPEMQARYESIHRRLVLEPREAFSTEEPR